MKKLNLSVSDSKIHGLFTIRVVYAGLGKPRSACQNWPATCLKFYCHTAMLIHICLWLL